jgi:hypothetical protein
MTQSPHRSAALTAWMATFTARTPPARAPLRAPGKRAEDVRAATGKVAAFIVDAASKAGSQ